MRDRGEQRTVVDQPGHKTVSEGAHRNGSLDEILAEWSCAPAGLIGRDGGEASLARSDVETPQEDERVDSIKVAKDGIEGVDAARKEARDARANRHFRSERLGLYTKWRQFGRPRREDGL